MNDQTRQPSRRDLLGGAVSQGITQPDTQDEAVDFGPLFHFSANAMGCEFQILCTADGRQSLANSVTDAFELIDDLEKQLSIYRTSSELSAINKMAFDAPVKVEAGLFELLEKACEISKITHGAFDITATPLSRLWKKHRQQRTLPDQAAVEIALIETGSSKLIFDRSRQTIRFLQPELVIDLGGIGKGYALDQLKTHLIHSGCHDFLIHGGQSSVVACGHRVARDGTRKQPWQIGISHPLTPGIRLANLTLSDQAIGTSGSGRQSYIVNGKRYGHIIDPRTGWPADLLLSVTVVADSALMADALATAIFVAGPHQAQEICDRYQLSAVLVAGDTDSQPQITAINLSEDEIQLV